jgi:Predicted acyl-CoA transferases/carnitine dehydratase
VIKVENPTDGDLARKLGNVPKLNKELMGTSFLAQNANKKSLTLNLKKPEAKEIFRKLAATADVVVENFRPGVMKRLGVGGRRSARSTRASSTARSPASARTAPTPTSPPTTRSSRGSRARWT